MDAVVLLSGGLDSATVLAMARHEGYRCFALTFRYGQRHGHEVAAAVRVAHALGAVRHRIVDLDLGSMGGSALTDTLPVPKHQSVEEIGTEIPITYVPARNTVFLAHALAWAEVLGAEAIFLGVNALDYSGYPDCRPEYIAAFQSLANLATKSGVEGQPITLRTPLIQCSKAQILRKGLELGVDFGLTTSCYDPNPMGQACGQCDACLLRLKGFRENQLADPIAYMTTDKPVA